ncbi:MAG: hypothetical protein CMF50_01800 [Legionellales bacterium]|nr:hypothetical protein [Legionellales bacterium]|tara:strand:+ start:10904 stop:11512 length:609 start_codon:yes stop_codon:yes gene_type:complete
MSNKSTLRLVSTVLTGTLALGIASTGFAEGVYFGGALGRSDLDYTASNQKVSPAKRHDEKGLGWKGLLGYQVNRNFAVEGSYTHYHEMKLKNMRGIPGANGKIDQAAYDLSAKGILPIGNQWNAFGKLGLAYVDADKSRNSTAKVNGIRFKDESAFRPTVGIGGTYIINQNLTTDISWNRVISGSGIKTSDFWGWGLNYFFN